MPPRPPERLKRLHGWLSLTFGLLLAAGYDDAVMVACSVLVEIGIAVDKGGASALLRRAEREGIIWNVDSREPLDGMGDGTKRWLPGRRPDGPEPRGGWRILSAASDGTPDAGSERGEVGVKAFAHDARIPVEPSVKPPDQTSMRAAVGGAIARGVTFGLDSGITAGNAALLGLGHERDDNRVIGGGPRRPSADRSSHPLASLTRGQLLEACGPGVQQLEPDLALPEDTITCSWPPRDDDDDPAVVWEPGP